MAARVSASSGVSGARGARREPVHANPNLSHNREKGVSQAGRGIGGEFEPNPLGISGSRLNQHGFPGCRSTPHSTSKAFRLVHVKLHLHNLPRLRVRYF